MICPSCSNTLTSIEANNVLLDACVGGCGGLWFDSDELAKLEDPSTTVLPNVLRVEKNALVVVDHSRTRCCPRCSSPQPLQEHAAMRSLGVEVDSCFACGGVWLDLGELDILRSDHKQVAEMEKIIAEYERKAASPDAPKGIWAVLKLLFS